jgi:membrane associated rhomboid family serine protease
VIGEDHLEFLQAVWSRRTHYTYLFFCLNILIFILMAFAGGSTNEPTLMAFGVKANPEIVRGQWWRFVTPIFLHIGVLHLAFNSYALWIVGPQVEKLYGGPRFVILYVLTGVAGVAASYFYHPLAPSAGASGAIFGLFGVLLVFGIRYRKNIPPHFARAVGTGVLPVIVLNLIIGFSIPGIDNSAHIGGLLAGAALAAIVPYQRPGGETHGIFMIAHVFLIALIGLSFYNVWKAYDGPHLSIRNVGRSFTQVLGTRSSTQEFIDAINNTQKTFTVTVEDLKTNRLEHLVALRSETSKCIDQLRNAPSLSATSDRLMADLLRLMQDQYDLIQEVQRVGTMTLGTSLRLTQNFNRYEVIMGNFSKWAQTEGARYGIQMGKGR